MNGRSITQFVALLALFFVACGDDDDSRPRDAGIELDGRMNDASNVEALISFCTELALQLCEACVPFDRNCLSDVSTDCARNGYARLPERRYEGDLGAACLAGVEDIDCDDPPLSCEGLVAIEACDYFLDGQTTDTCVDGGGS